MKKTKLLSLALALLMLFGMMLPTTMTAFAAGGTSTITVSSPENIVLDADWFCALKLFDVVKNGESWFYTPVSWITGFLAAKPAYGSDLQEWLETNKTDQEKMTELLYDLVMYSPKPYAATATQIEPNQVQFNGLENGYYMVWGNSETDNGYAIFPHYTLITVDEQGKDFPINVKADVPTLLKEASLDGETWVKDYYSTAPGNTVSFRLTTAVPNMFGYTSYTFNVHDIARGLTYDEDSFIVTLDGTPMIAKDDDEHEFDYDYELIFTDNGEYASNFEIKFDSDKFVDLTPGDEIVITYDGILHNVSIPENVFGAVNEAWVSFSNHPFKTYITRDNPEAYFGTFTADTAHSVVRNVCHGIILNKFDNNPGKGFYADFLEHPESFANALPGAEFKLWKGGSTVKFVLDEMGGEFFDTALESMEIFEEGQDLHISFYRPATDEEIANGTLGVDFTDTLVTPNSGMIMIMGLPLGIYSLEESKAPANFNKLTSMIEIEFGYDAEHGSITCLIDNVQRDLSSSVFNGELGWQILVGNHSGSMLPGTGGIGTTIFYIVGISLALGLAATFVIRRKRNALSALNAK